MTNSNLQERAIRAAMKYLEMQGFTDVERVDETHVAGWEYDTLVLTSVGVVTEGFAGILPDTREEHEEAMFAYLGRAGFLPDFPSASTMFSFGSLAKVRLCSSILGTA